MTIKRTFKKMCCNLTVLHSFWVFVRERRWKATPLTFTAPCIRRRTLGMGLLGLRLDWLGLVNLLWRLAVAVLFPLTFLVGQLPVQSRRGHLMGLFHFEKHWRGGTVLHGPEFTDRGRTVWAVSIMTLLTPLCGSVWVGIWALNPSHLFLGLDLTGVFWSLGCSFLGSILALSGWFHSLCFCRRTFVANTASQ